MFKKKFISGPISIVLSLLLLLDFAVFTPAPARALDKKSLAVGAGVGLAAGAGVVLAAPAIGSAMAAAGCGIAGVGSAIVGGLAAAGGAIVGAIAAVGGAIAAAGAAVVGWIAGIIASPLFIPALIVIGVCVAGYLIYRHYKKKNQDTSCKVIPENDKTIVTPGEYDMNPVVPPMNQAGGVTISDEDTLTIPGGEVTVSSDLPTGVTTVTGDSSATSGNAAVTGTALNLREAEARYKAAYKAYTKLVTTGGKGDVKSALAEYKAAFEQYESLKKAGK